MATIKEVAKAAKVSTATVSAVLNETSYVSPELKARVEKAVKDLNYLPLRAARVLRRGRSELIAISVADLSNPFYSQFVLAAEAAASDAGYSLVVFNSDERYDLEKRILSRARTLGCDGVLLVPVGTANSYTSEYLTTGPPKVLLGRSIGNPMLDTITIDNFAAGRKATNYLIDLGHQRIGSITGRLNTSTGRERLEGMKEAMDTRRLTLDPHHIKSGEFREEQAYSAAYDMLSVADRPTALYVANGIMALGVMRALKDLGLGCPTDISIASTDTVAGHGGVSPLLTRTEHPVAEMTSEAIRILIERIESTKATEPKKLVFAPALVVGDSCTPLRYSQI